MHGQNHIKKEYETEERKKETKEIRSKKGRKEGSISQRISK